MTEYERFQQIMAEIELKKQIEEASKGNFDPLKLFYQYFGR